VLSPIDSTLSAIRSRVIIRFRARHDAHSTCQSRFVERFIGDAHHQRWCVGFFFSRAAHRDQLAR